MSLKINCPICEKELLKDTSAAYLVILNKKPVYICKTCYYNYYYNTDRMCNICGKIVRYPYLIKKNNIIKHVCKGCERLY